MSQSVRDNVWVSFSQRDVTGEMAYLLQDAFQKLVKSSEYKVTP